MAFDNAAAAAEKLKNRLKIKEEEADALEARVAQVSAQMAEEQRSNSLHVSSNSLHVSSSSSSI
jgi:hypothetical protein